MAMRISIFGLSYVGAISAGCLATDDHRVVGVRSNPTKVELINAGLPPIVDAKIGGIIAAGAASVALASTPTRLPQCAKRTFLPTTCGPAVHSADPDCRRTCEPSIMSRVVSA